MARADQGWREHVLNNILPRLDASLTEAPTGFAPAPLATVVAPTPLAGDFHVQPAFDVIERLPERAQDRLRKLRLRAADLHKLVLPFEDVRELSMAKIAAANALKRLTDHPQDGGFNLDGGDRRVIEATKLVEKTTADFQRLQELQQVRTAAWVQASQAKSFCEGWLRDGQPHGTVLEDYEGEVPKLAKGESLMEGILRLQRRCRELKADIHRIQSAPYPSAYAKAQMRAQIEQLAQRGEPSVARLVELDGPVEFQTQTVRSAIHSTPPGVAHAEIPDALALIAWLHSDLLGWWLDKLIDAEADDKNALSHADREVRIAEAQGDLVDVERQESFFVWQAQSENLPVEHRSDCSPIAILQVQLITTARSTELPGSSPQHAAHNLIGGGR